MNFYVLINRIFYLPDNIVSIGDLGLDSLCGKPTLPSLPYHNLWD